MQERELDYGAMAIRDIARKSPYYHPANGRSICPFCSSTRRNKSDRCLSYTIRTDGSERVLYECKHCSESGIVVLEQRPFVQPRRKREEKPQPIPLTDVQALSPEHFEWLTEVRNISAEVVTDWGIVSGTKWFRKVDTELPCFGFPYVYEGNTTAIKWRTTDKKEVGMTQDGAAKIFYGLNHLSENAKQLIITEGELDALAYATVGVENVLSVPNGAPDKKPDENYVLDAEKDQVKFAYLWHSKELIEKADKIYLSTDGDLPGDYLAEELARRIGKAKCWRVTYPEGCKDANDVLIQHGEDALRECVAKAAPWPISGLNGANHYRDKVLDLYRNGPAKGVGIDLREVDEIVKWVPGEFYLVTGIPGMGKSEFIDYVTFRTASWHNWNWAYCSFENPTHDHLSKLARKYVRKPFFTGQHVRMTEKELNDAIDWIDERFVFVNQEDGLLPTIDNIIEMGKAAVLRAGIRGIVVDPFNYINRNAEAGVDGIREILTKFSKFVRDYELVGILVAHPAKQKRDESGAYRVADGYDVSGSADFYNIPDFGLTVHRQDKRDTLTEVHNWKTRRTQNGCVGSALIEYDALSGLYIEPAKEKQGWQGQQD